jgi:hypothetical protein
MQMSAGDLIALPKARHLPDHAVRPQLPETRSGGFCAEGTLEHDAADRSHYPLAIDQDNSTPINFAESINFPPFQKIRTHRRSRG